MTERTQYSPQGRVSAAQEEVAAISVRSPSARRFLAAEATVPAVLTALDGANLAHIAAHRQLRTDNPAVRPRTGPRPTDGVRPGTPPPGAEDRDSASLPVRCQRDPRGRRGTRPRLPRYCPSAPRTVIATLTPMPDARCGHEAPDGVTARPPPPGYLPLPTRCAPPARRPIPTTTGHSPRPRASSASTPRESVSARWSTPERDPCSWRPAPVLPAGAGRACRARSRVSAS